MTTPAITRICFSAGERASGAPEAAKVAAAVDAVRRDGVVILEGVYESSFIGEIHKDFMGRYSAYMKPILPRDAHVVGDRRCMIPIEIAGIYNQPYLYAHSLVFYILQGLLGQRFIMAGFGAVTSTPGSDQQHIHRDHEPLFSEDDLERDFPPFALTVVIPLIDMNGMTGSTRFYPGTHRVPREKARLMPFVDPDVPIGSCVIWDYLLYHGGLPNRSEVARPIMYFSYSRAWFRDSVNYITHEPIHLSYPEYMKMPETLRPLFSWVVTAPTGA